MHRPDVRASDLDRERAVEFLKAHYAAGRLQDDELAWRSDAAYRAVGDLRARLAHLRPPGARRARPRAGRRFSPLKAAVLFALFIALARHRAAGGLAGAVRDRAAMHAFVGFFLIAPIAIPALLHRGRRVPDRARDAAA